LVAKASGETLIVLKKGNVLGTVAAKGLEQNETLDHLALTETALTGLELDVGLDQTGQSEGTDGSGGGQQTGVGAAHFLQRTGVEGEGRFIERRDSSWHK